MFKCQLDRKKTHLKLNVRDFFGEDLQSLSSQHGAELNSQNLYCDKNIHCNMEMLRLSIVLISPIIFFVHMFQGFLQVFLTVFKVYFETVHMHVLILEFRSSYVTQRRKDNGIFPGSMTKFSTLKIIFLQQLCSNINSNLLWLIIEN